MIRLGRRQFLQQLSHPIVLRQPAAATAGRFLQRLGLNPMRSGSECKIPADARE